MAAADSSLEEELCCAVCSDFFKDPVLLKCSHSFCRVCLQKCWEQNSFRECPLCRRKSSMKDPPVSLTLRNIVESYLKKRSECEVAKKNEAPQESESHCSLHGEKLIFFCVEDQEPICVVCQTARKHRDHQLYPLEEAVEDKKEDLRASLIPLKEKLEKFTKVKQEFEETAKHIKSQSQHTEKRIKEEFEQLHQFLREEEEARLAILRVEEMEKSEGMKEKIENISKHVSTLSEKITDIEKVMGAEDISFLKKTENYQSREEEEARLTILRVEEKEKSERMKEKIENISKHVSTLSEKIRDIEKVSAEDISFLKTVRDTKEKAQCSLQDPKLASRALIDVAKHLGSLKFRVWEKMLGIVQYTPVTLDPNTASPWLSVSDDLTSVRHTGVKQQLPDNPERLSPCVNVLGSEGFNSGKHSWEVEVGDKTDWDVGVAAESVNRKGGIRCSPENGFWVVRLRNGDEYTACDSPSTHLRLKRKPQRIRVQLNYDKRQVSFFNPADMSRIYTFKDTFTGRLFPFLSPYLKEDGKNAGALKICPIKVSVTVTSSQ